MTRWTDKEECILIKLYNIKDDLEVEDPYIYIALVLQRSVYAIKGKIRYLIKKAKKLKRNIRHTKISLLPFVLKLIINRYYINIKEHKNRYHYCIYSHILISPSIHVLSVNSQSDIYVSLYEDITKKMLDNYIAYMEVLFSTDNAARVVEQKMKRDDNIIIGDIDKFHVVYVGIWNKDPYGIYTKGQCCTGTISFFRGYLDGFTNLYEKHIDIKDVLKYERLIRNKFVGWRKKESSQNYGDVPIKDVIKFIENI